MRLLFLVAVFGLLSGCKTAESAQRVPALPKALAVETFEAAWQIVNDTHFDTNFSGVNWSAARTEYLPRAQKARTDEQLREVIQEMLDLLGHSHLMILEGKRPSITNAAPPANPTTRSADPAPKPPIGEGSPAFDYRAINNQIVVTRVEPDLLPLGLRPGAIIRSIDNQPAVEKDLLAQTTTSEQRAFAQWHHFRDLLRGPLNEKASLLVDTGAGIKRLAVPRSPGVGELSQLGNLPPMRTRVEAKTIQTPAGKRVGFVRFNYWLLPLASAFDKFIDEHRNADAIIIDLRGNVGGIGAMASGLAGHMVNQRATLGVMKMRDNELNFPVFPRRVDSQARATNTFQGKLAVLLDPISLSTSELFAAGLQELGRARIFGERSGGQALPAISEHLPNGDLLYHAIADFTTPKGRRLEDAGVLPDVVVPLRLQALRAGRDEPLEAALLWIDSPPQAAANRVD